MNAFKPLSLVVVVAAMSACSTQIERDVRSNAAATPTHLHTQPLASPGVHPLGSPASVQSSAASLNRDRLVRTSASPWIGGVSTVTKRDARLPAVFEQKHVLDFGNERVSLATVAARLTRLTSIPVRIRGDVYEAIGAESVPVVGDLSKLMPAPMDAIKPGAALPAAGAMPAVSAAMQPLSRATPNSIDAVEMRWNGRLRDFLDHLTNTLSLSWEYQDGAVVIMRLVTESYQLATTPGKQTYTLTAGGTGGGTSSSDGVSVTSQAGTQISSTGILDVKESILKTVNKIIEGVPNSFASWSDATSRLVVATSKEGQARVREYLDRENKALRQRVNVTFDIYSVRKNVGDEQGVNWSAVFNSLNTRYGIEFLSPMQLTSNNSGGLKIATTSRDLTTTHNAMLNLLAQHGESVQHRPVSVTSSQGVWDSTGRLSTTGYLKETTPGNSSGTGAAGAPGLKTDMITTGDQYSVLPIVQSDNTTLVRFNITLSDLLGLYDVSTGSGDTFQRVQTPKVEAITKGSMVNLAPGETAVITGLSRRVSNREENRLTEDAPLLAGGSRRASISTEHLLILVRATPL